MRPETEERVVRWLIAWIHRWAPRIVGVVLVGGAVAIVLGVRALVIVGQQEGWW